MNPTLVLLNAVLPRWKEISRTRAFVLGCLAGTTFLVGVSWARAETDSPAPVQGDGWILPELELADPRPSPIRPGVRNEKWDGDEAFATAVALASGGTGGLLANRLDSVSSTVTGVPGESGSLLGIGRRADDVSVGTPSGLLLDPPQGGGFDLNSFPSYFWQAASLEQGPASLSEGGVHRAAAVCTLTPWVDGDDGSRGLLLGGVSSLGVGQVAVGHRWGRDGGALAGWQFGRQEGPGLSLRKTMSFFGDWEAEAQLMGAVQSSVLDGSLSYPTPGARQNTARWLPGLTFLKRAGTGEGISGRDSEPSLRIDLSADQLDLGYADSSHGVATSDLSRRFRMAAQVRASREMFFFGEVSQSELQQGLADRRGENHAERVGVVGWSGRLRTDPDSEWEAQLKAVGVQGLGVHPEVSLKWERGPAQDGVELAWTRKFPTLLDRFYEFPPYFSGNPDLAPEGVATLRISAGERRFADGLIGFQWNATLQRRDQVILSTGFETPENGGTAWVGSWEPELVLRGRGDWERWSIRQALTLLGSRLVTSEGASSLPLQPVARGGTALVYAAGRWSADAGLRASAPLPVSEGESLPAFAVVSLGWNLHIPGAGAWSRGGSLSVRIDDLLNRKPEQIPDFRGPGRAFSIALGADLN